MSADLAGHPSHPRRDVPGADALGDHTLRTQRPRRLRKCVTTAAPQRNGPIFGVLVGGVPGRRQSLTGGAWQVTEAHTRAEAGQPALRESHEDLDRAMSATVDAIAVATGQRLGGRRGRRRSAGPGYRGDAPGTGLSVGTALADRLVTPAGRRAPEGLPAAGPATTLDAWM